MNKLKKVLLLLVSAMLLSACVIDDIDNDGYSTSRSVSSYQTGSYYQSSNAGYSSSSEPANVTTTYSSSQPRHYRPVSVSRTTVSYKAPQPPVVTSGFQSSKKTTVTTTAPEAGYQESSNTTVSTSNAGFESAISAKKEKRKQGMVNRASGFISSANNGFSSSR